MSEEAKKTWDLTQHRVWGSQIHWFDFSSLKLTGHTRPFPKPGDTLLCPKYGKFSFKKVEGVSGVGDMWFAYMETDND